MIPLEVTVTPGASLLWVIFTFMTGQFRRHSSCVLRLRELETRMFPGDAALNDRARPNNLSESASLKPDRLGRMLLLAILTAIAFGASGGLANAQGDGANLLALERMPQLAPVRIDGRTLFQVRGVSAYPAAERAQAIVGRIKDVASDSSVSSNSLRRRRASTQLTYGRAIISSSR
jgi:hypothetical protein